MKKVLYLSIIGAIIVVFGCRKAFNPVIDTADVNILVVEGMVNTGTDSTIIKLSRTVPIGNKTTVSSETKAVVTIETAQATILTLTENARGIYVAPPKTLDNTKQYRVRIRTVNGKVYLSDLVDAKVTPPIDSIGFLVKDDKLQVYANTHDATNKTRYYRYSFRETWMFNSNYPSNFITNGKDIVGRTPAQAITTCFSSDTSAYTLINSTAQLSQDVAFHVPIDLIDGTSEKISIKYSILLRQQGITKEAYDFYENLKKNTESLGNIFDAQPSQLTGNIHNIADATEPVIGYMTAGTTQQKRIFILKSQLPQSFVTKYPYGCELDSAFNGPVPKDRFHSAYTIETLIPIQNPIQSVVILPFTSLAHETGWLFTDRPCGDCTLRGAIKPPYFWK
ncbi:MAG: DUF4249 domain-containing protein [Bacteroidota bacterium]